jgi:predicted amidohydrolase YtcJ
MRPITALAGLLAVALAPAARAEATADLVLTNGYVYTVDAQDSVRSALAVRDGIIVYVGDDRGAAAYVGPATRRIDLRGQMAMPGLVDGHMHPLPGGAQLLSCSLDYRSLTIAEFQSRIQACLDSSRDREPDAWMVVVNWFQQNMQPPGVEMTRAALDALNTKRPVVVQSSFGHSSLVNTRALLLSGVVAATPDPVGGQIHHDAKGEPTGLLEDAAQQLVAGNVPPPTASENVASAKAALDAMRRQGITSFFDAAASPASLEAFAAVQRQGGLTARAHFAPVLAPKDGPHPDAALAGIKALARRYDQGPLAPAPSMTVRQVKLFMDGVITAPAFTGVMVDPYFVNLGSADHPKWAPGPSKGPAPYFPPPILAPILAELARSGFDPHLHADGDGAVRIALDAIETVRRSHPDYDFRPAIAHDEIVDPHDFARFGSLGAIPVLSFQWEKPAPDTLEGARDYLGPDRFKVFEPAGLLAARGARIAYGSDWPVDPLNEWFALKVGVTRENAPEAGPKYAGRLSEDPGLSLKAALRAITMNAAYELREEQQTGSLEAGKFADLIVLDRNLFQIAPEAIADTRVLLTVVGGKLVYTADGGL